MTDVSRSYLVCATQRSGSTLLCELLKDTGVAGRPEEYFEAMRDTGVPPRPRDFLEGLAAPGLGIEDESEPSEAPAYSSLVGLADYRAHLERTFALGTTPNGIFGAKLMFNQLGELRALAGRLPEYAGLDLDSLFKRLFGAPRYIWVSRGDRLRQAVSMWRALQTRRWRADGGGAQATSQYHGEAIDHLARRFDAEDDGWRRFFSRHRIKPLTVTYEDDLERDPEATVRRALQWIGVSAPVGWRPRQPMLRQADALSDEWIAAYHRDPVAPRSTAEPASGRG
jgi:LPS sulfotransferase NodH